jgi:uncharacterized protein (TIGR03067 family)
MFPLALAAALALPVSGGDALKKAVAEDLKQLKGRWELVSAIIEGEKKALPTLRRKRRLIIQGDKFTQFLRDGGRSSFKIDPTRRPKVIYFHFLDGPFGGLNSWAIYDVNGDELRLCGSTGDEHLPNAFATAKDDGKILLTYRRVPAGPTGEDDEGPAAKASEKTQRSRATTPADDEATSANTVMFLFDFDYPKRAGYSCPHMTFIGVIPYIKSDT